MFASATNRGDTRESQMKVSSLILAVMAVTATLATPSFPDAQPRRRAPARSAPVIANTPTNPPATATPAATPAPAAPPTAATSVPSTAPTEAPPSERSIHVHASGFIGSGVGAVSGLGASFGGRVGFAFGTRWRFYIGGTASYHGGEDTTTYQTDSATFAQVSTTRTADYTLAGVELGPEFAWRWLLVRAYVTGGAFWTTSTCTGYLCAPSAQSKDKLGFYGIGISPSVAVGPATFGLDFRGVNTIGNGDAGSACAACSHPVFLSLAFTAGFTLE